MLHLPRVNMQIRHVGIVQQRGMSRLFRGLADNEMVDVPADRQGKHEGIANG